MKKVLTLICIGALTIGLLGGCSNNSSKENASKNLQEQKVDNFNNNLINEVESLKEKINNLEQQTEEYELKITELKQQIRYNNNYYENLMYEEKGKYIRALGKSDYGEIIIKSRDTEQIEQLIGELPRLGLQTDYTIKGSYEVIFRDRNNEEKIITTFKDLQCVQPINRTIKIKKIKLKDLELFYFTPMYRNTSDNIRFNQVYFFGVTAEGKSFQFKFNNENNKDIVDSAIISRESEVKVVKNQLKLIQNGYSEERQRLDIYTYTYNPNIKNKTMEFVNKKYLRRGTPE